MHTALLRALEQLAQQTRDLLADSASDLEAWEAYGERRAAVFACLRECDFQVDGAARAVVSTLIHEILAQDVVLAARAQEQLSGLRAALGALATSRRALRGYMPAQPALLLERCA